MKVTLLLFLCLIFLGSGQDILTYKIKTPTNGKTHLAMVPTAGAKLKTLFVFFHGTTESASSCTRLGRLGSQLGYFTVLISYKSVPSVRSLCNWWDCVSCTENNECFEGIRDERVFGANQSKIDKTTWNDSLEGMLVYVLKKMSTIDPQWKQFLQNDALPDYSNMIVAGHSQGAGHAAFIASRYKVKRVILFSGTHEVAAWNTRSRNPTFQTPSDRIYAFSHIQDTSGGWRFLLGWETLEIPCGPQAKMEQIPFGDNGREWCAGVYVDDAVDPSFDFQGNHRLLLQGSWIFSKRKAHVGTALDRAVPNLYKNNIGGKPRWYGVVWRYLLMDNATMLGPDEWELPDLKYGSFDNELQNDEKQTKEDEEDEEERDENEEGEDFINENDKDQDDDPEETDTDDKKSKRPTEKDETEDEDKEGEKKPVGDKLRPEPMKQDGDKGKASGAENKKGGNSKPEPRKQGEDEVSQEPNPKNQKLVGNVVEENTEHKFYSDDPQLPENDLEEGEQVVVGPKAVTVPTQLRPDGKNEEVCNSLTTPHLFNQVRFF